MRKLIFILLITHCSLIIAQTPTEEWVKRFSGNGFASGLSVKLDSSGNVYVLMKLSTDSTSGDFGIVKYSNSGNLLWSTYYNSPGNLNDAPEAFDVTKAGDVYITGNSSNSFTGHMTTVKFNTNGIFQWAKTDSLVGSSNISADNQGNVIVVGGIESGSVSSAYLVKYNFDGDSLFTRTFRLALNSARFDFALFDDSNNIYTAGSDAADFLVVKYNSSGNFIWYATYSSTPNYQDYISAMFIDTNRNTYVVGSTFVPGAYFNNMLVKVSSLGLVQWAKVFTGILNGNAQCASQPKGLAVSSDGNSVYYTTSCYSNSALSDIVTLKYTSSGDSVWLKRYNGGVSNTANGPAALKLDKYNDIYITGVANRQTSGDDFVTIKYLPDGTQQWTAFYNGQLTNSNDISHDLITDNNMNVYITGISNRNTVALWDAVTIKYSQPDGIHQISNNIPNGFKLEQNYPNPFNSQTKIKFEIPRSEEIKIIVYDIIGRVSETLVNEELKPGTYEADWDANNFSSGVYFYTLITKTYRETKKTILIK